MSLSWILFPVNFHPGEILILVGFFFAVISVMALCGIYLLKWHRQQLEKISKGESDTKQRSER